MKSKVQYILKSVNANMTAYCGFKWPKRGKVVAPDWEPTSECGNGLHGFLNGEGEGSLANWNTDAKWLVVAVRGKIIDLGGKVKFESGSVVYCGDRAGATAYLRSKGCDGPIVGKCIVSDGKVETIGGYRSTLTAGESSTLTASDVSTLTAGNNSTLTAGECSTLTAGHTSTLTADPCSTLTAGGASTLTAGSYSKLTAGHRSTLTAGIRSTLTWKIWDGNYYRLHTFYVGESGVLPNVPYVFENGKIKKKK